VPKRVAVAALASLSLPLAAPVHAQAYQCHAPELLPAPPRIDKPEDAPRRIRPIAGYLLTLSWSPEYCRTRSASVRDRAQCGAATEDRLGDFGFVLHGLWPEAADARYPQWCKARPAPVPPEVVRENLCRTPSAALIAHEWAKHGSCMGVSPETYFATAATLFDAVRYPDMERLSRGDLTIGMFARAFAEANPGLEPEMVLVETSERGWLEEVRLCLGKDFRPRACPGFQRRPRGDTPLKIWRGL